MDGILPFPWLNAKLLLPWLQPPRPLPFPGFGKAMGPIGKHDEFELFISPACLPGPWGCQSEWPLHWPPFPLPGLEELLPPLPPFPPLDEFIAHPCDGWD